jgi:hypothetical protein
VPPHNSLSAAVSQYGIQWLAVQTTGYSAPGSPSDKLLPNAPCSCWLEPCDGHRHYASAPSRKAMSVSQPAAALCTLKYNQLAAQSLRQCGNPPMHLKATVSGLTSTKGVIRCAMISQHRSKPRPTSAASC